LLNGVFLMQPISSKPNISVGKSNQNQEIIDNNIVNKANECFSDLIPSSSTKIDNKLEVILKDLNVLEQYIQNDPIFVCKNIKNFLSLDEKTRADVFIKCFQKVFTLYESEGQEVFKAFADFEIRDPEILFHVVSSISLTDTVVVYENIHIFNLSEDQRIKLVYYDIDNLIANRHERIGSNLKELNIENKNELIKLAYYLASKNSASISLCPCIQALEIEDINIRKDLFLLCFKNSSSSETINYLIEHMENFKLDDTTFLAEFSKELAQRDLDSFIKSEYLIKNLTQDQLIAISIEVMNKFNTTSIETFSCLTPKSKNTVLQEVKKIKYEQLLEWNAKNQLSKPDKLKEMFDALSAFTDLADLDFIIDRYGKTEEDRIAMALACANRNPTFLSSHIRDFKITNQSALFKIALFIAEENHEALCTYMNRFDLQEGKDRLKIAEIIMRKDVRLLRDSLSRFNLVEDEFFSFLNAFEWNEKELKDFGAIIRELSAAHRFEIAQRLVKNNPEYCCRHANFDLEQADYFKLCLEIMDVDPAFIYEIINPNKNFNPPLVADEYFELIKKKFDQNIDKFIDDYIKFFNIYINANHKVALAKMIAEKDCSKFFKHISQFDITDPKELINFARLAIKNQDSINDTNSLLISILHIAIRQDPLLTASSIKTLNIQNDDVKKFISNQLAYEDIGVFCAYIQELDIKENDLLFKLAQQAVEKNVKAICQNIHKFSLTEEQRLSILKLAVKEDVLAAAESIQNFGEIHDSELLKKIARSAILQDRSKMEKSLASFGLKNTDEIDEIEFAELSANIIKKKENLLQEQLYKFDPFLLELCGKRLLELKKRNTAFYINWTCKFLERAAALYQKKGNFQKAIELRLVLAEAKLIYPENPLSTLDTKLQHPVIISHPKGDINYGTVFNWMGSQELKGGHFRVRDITLDNQQKKVATFNLTYCAADEVRENLRLLKQADLAKLIESKLGTTIEVQEDKNFCYYTAINGEYDSTRPDKVEGSPVLTVDLKGLAKIQIGKDLLWGSMIDNVHITLEPGASPEDLQKVFSIMGLANIAIPSTDADIERLKVNFLIHFFYPKIAVIRDRKSEYFETPIPQLLEELEKQPEGTGLTQKIYKHLDKLKFYEIDGEQRLRLNNLSEQAERLGARGLYSGIYGKSIAKAAEAFASVMQSGFIPTEKRLELGWTNTAGASMIPDLKSGGAIAGFYRLITESALRQQPPTCDNQNLSGCMQILFKTKMLKLMPYFHSQDSYGNRNPFTDNVAIPVQAYENRPNLKEFVKANEKSWGKTNEVMLKGHLSAQKYVAGIVYQDPRKVLVADIEDKLSSGELSDTYKDFFSSCTNLEEKIQFTSDNRDKVLELLKSLPTFDQSKNTYKDYDVFDHWTLNPKLAIVDALKKGGVAYEGLVIQESDTFNNEIFANCHNIEKQLEKAKQKAMSIAGTFTTHKILGSQMTGDASQFINAIRKYFSGLSENELREYITKETTEKIIRLNRACGSRLYNFDFSGQDSLNRELLTGKWSTDLRDKNVILTLFALEALETKNGDPDTKSLITFLVDDPENPERSIPECLYRGLGTHHSALLEKLPNNLEPKTNSSLANQVIFLNEYIRRSNIEETFLPILTAINQAYKEVLGKAPDLTIQHTEDKLNAVYESKNWKEDYSKIFNAILDMVDKKSDQELLDLMASHYTPAELKGQALDGLKDLATKENLQIEEMTVEELVHAITTSFFLLDPKISHLFYDRLHILAALKSDAPIPTKDGDITIRDLMLAIMNSFKEGVTENNAIAAEQFYLRMALLYEKLS
jgi:hypothetical protein